MLIRRASMESVTMGIIADFWRGRLTLQTVYSKNSPTAAPDASEETEAVASIGRLYGAGGMAAAGAAPYPMPPARSRAGEAAAASRNSRPRPAFSPLCPTGLYRPIPSAYVWGRRLAYKFGSTTGRCTYNG